MPVAEARGTRRSRFTGAYPNAMRGYARIMSSPGLVVALDGPASSGKSSVGATAAAELGYRFCDTGLLYRAITWLALDRGVTADDPSGLVALVHEIELVDDGTGRLSRVAVDGVERTDDVRGPLVDAAVSAISGVAELRLALLTRQRRLASEGRIVMAGRDIGTVVLPDADLKLFLDASAEERARRRVLERGIDPTSAEAAGILAELRRRDELDSSRPIAPLRAAPDAVVIRTDGNALEDTVRQVVEAIRNAVRLAEAGERGAATAVAGGADVGGAAVADEPSDAPPEREPRRLRASAPARAPRRPIRPTPVATRIVPIIRFVTAVLRAVVRAIVRLQIEGDLNAVPRRGAMILAANHASSADPVLIGAFLNQILGRPLNWLGKRELLDFPLTGWLARQGGIHPVDRDAADLEAFRAAMRVLEADEMLAVFPEGTRSRDGALQQVREGVGMLALRSGAPVLPVAVIDSDLMWPRGKLLPRFGRRVTVRYGTPFSVTDELAAAGIPARGREATAAATRLVMTRIAELLPPRQRGVYASEVGAPPPAAAE
jgi:cytidylate kinase